ncbi:MAG: ABC transporter permease [Planctomycetes bacterium]|nr:ABC transporter permease [Planctomycetota bacterium]MBL7043869.1 ABC transporter permease [Pirellulaceae bacterium]
MFLKIITSQARHKWGIALLIVLAMTSLVTLYVYSSNTTAFANRSMQLVMKNMGHNLLIIPEKADARSIYLCSDDQTLFSDDTTRRISRARNLSSRYYVSVLQARVEVESQELLLTGVEPVGGEHETPEKRNMVLPLAESETRLGYECARMLQKDIGESVHVLGGEFRVVEILPPKATLDDCRIYISLSRCQGLLGKEGQINFILAFLCLHGGSLDRALKVQEQKLAEMSPGFRQISRMDIAQGRHFARITTQKSLYYLLGIVAAATVIVIAVTGLQEVSDRRHETGIMISMGVSHTYIVCLYLVKTLALALTSSVLGFLLGSALAVRFTAPFLVVNTRPVAVLWDQLPAAMALTCAVALVAEIIPIIRLLRLDPNTILAEQ